MFNKTHQIAPFKKNISLGSMLPDLPSKRLATPRVACNSPSPQYVGSPLANPTNAHGLLLKILFEEMRLYISRWQTVDCQ